MKNILITNEETDLKHGCSFGMPWDHADNYMNFPYPDEVWQPEDIDDRPKDDVRGVIVGCDLEDYSLLAGFHKTRALYIYNGHYLTVLDLLRDMIRLQQLYIHDSLVSDITPLLQLIEAKKELLEKTVDLRERLSIPMTGISISSNTEIRNANLLAGAGNYELWINGKRIR